MNKKFPLELTGSQLKIIAMISMLIDHIGAVLFPGVMWLRIIGRLAFPIYCFILTEGFRYTKDIKKYLIRLLIFAFISEPFFDLAMRGRIIETGHQNVYFTLFLSLIALYILEKDYPLVVRMIGVFVCMGIADLLHTDYRAGGVATVLIFYFFKDNLLLIFAMLFGTHGLIWGWIQTPAVLSVIPISMYNHKRGHKSKYIFYVFYPLHLFVLFLIRRYV